MIERAFYIYIMANDRPTLFIGMTSNLVRRIYEHKHGLVDGFTKKYNLHKLVHYEIAETGTAAIQREKNLKKWPRQWKLELIQKSNPEFYDLWPEIIGDDPRVKPEDDEEL